MPDFSMFGPAESGSRLAQQDWLSNQIKLGQIAEQPWKIRETAATAQKAEMQLHDEQRWSQLLQNVSTPGGTDASGKPQDLAGMYDNLANLALKAGLPDQATKLAKTSAYIHSHEASAARSNAAVGLDHLKAASARAEMVGSLFGAVTDQQSWDRANLLYQVQTGEVSPYAGLPYEPKMVKGIVDGTIKAKDQYKLKMDAENLASQERARKDLERHRKVIEDIYKNRNELAAKREKRLAREGGGKAVTSPSKPEVDQAINIIDNEFKDLPNADKVSAAFEVASEARALRKQNPALDAGEALNRAFLAAKQRGDFQLIVEKNWLKDTKKERFIGGGRTPESAIPVPKTAGERVVGRWYYNPQGQIAQWSGKGWKLAPKTSGLSGNNSTGNTGGGDKLTDLPDNPDEE